MLYYTIGLPRSGKSTLCDEWVNYNLDINKHHQFYHRDYSYKGMDHAIVPPAYKNEQPRVIICSDDIRIALHGRRYITQAEETVHSIQRIMIRALLNRGFDVIVDGTHTTKNSIKRMLGFDKNAQYVYINTSAEECQKRAIETDQPDLCDVISRMELSLQELCKDPYGNKLSLEFAIEDIRMVFLIYGQSDEKINDG